LPRQAARPKRQTGGQEQLKNPEQTQGDSSGDGKPLMNQHILSSTCFTNGTLCGRRAGTFAVAPGKSAFQEAEEPNSRERTAEWLGVLGIIPLLVETVWLAMH
jgi:hypothetical protein